MDLKEFIDTWRKSITNHDDKRIYSLNLYLFKQFLPELQTATPESPILGLLPFLREVIPQMIDKNYKKSAQIRQFLNSVYDNAFNKSQSLESPGDQVKSTESSVDSIDFHGLPEDVQTHEIISVDEDDDLDSILSIEPTQGGSTQWSSSTPKKLELNPVSPQESYQLPQFPNTPKMDELPTEVIQPEDTKGSEFFKARIQTVVEDHFIDLFHLLNNKLLANNPDLSNILLYLIGIFQDAPERIINELLSYSEKGKISLTTFKLLLEKCLDKDPTPIIFTIVNYIQEDMMGQQLSAQDLAIFESIMSIFQEYVEYYPDYFVNQINLCVGLLGNYSTKISDSVSKILLFYAKNGEEQIEQLFFEIYEKLELVDDSVRTTLLHTLHDALDNGPTLVLDAHHQENHGFEKSLIKMIYKNMKHANKGIQDLSFEIAIAMWNYDSQLLIFKQEPLSKILKPIIDILKQILAEKLYYPYLFLHAVKDIENTVIDRDSNHPKHEFQNKFALEDQINTPEKFFENLKNFLREIQNVK